MACPHAVSGLFPEGGSLPFDDAVAFAETAAKMPELTGRVRLIPYTAVGSKGMLAAFRADRVVVGGEEKELLTAVSERVWGDGFEGII